MCSGLTELLLLEALNLDEGLVQGEFLAVQSDLDRTCGQSIVVSEDSKVKEKRIQDGE